MKFYENGILFRTRSGRAPYEGFEGDSDYTLFMREAFTTARARREEIAPILARGDEPSDLERTIDDYAGRQIAQALAGVVPKDNLDSVRGGKVATEQRLYRVPITDGYFFLRNDEIPATIGIVSLSRDEWMAKTECSEEEKNAALRIGSQLLDILEHAKVEAVTA